MESKSESIAGGDTQFTFGDRSTLSKFLEEQADDTFRRRLADRILERAERCAKARWLRVAAQRVECGEPVDDVLKDYGYQKAMEGTP
jgi:hypothetical protein